MMEAKRDPVLGIGSLIDLTLLKPESTRRELERLCDEAIEARVAAVCVNGMWVSVVADRVVSHGIQVAAVVGFPLGAMASRAKVEEARLAVAEGATELDMVMALGLAKDGGWMRVEHDITAVVRSAGSALIKVIIESGALTPEEIVRACAVAESAGAHFVKTSTGFHPSGGATVEAVGLMRRSVSDRIGVKASGGIRTGESALQMIRAGATRIGTSSLAGLREVLGPTAPSLAELLTLA